METTEVRQQHLFDRDKLYAYLVQSVPSLVKPTDRLVVKQFK